MITSDAWAGKRFAVLGLARSGAAVVRALVASGADVVAWDEDAARRAQFLPVDEKVAARRADGGGSPQTVSLVESPLHPRARRGGPLP